jgi:hypothetical protein
LEQAEEIRLNQVEVAGSIDAGQFLRKRLIEDLREQGSQTDHRVAGLPGFRQLGHVWQVRDDDIDRTCVRQIIDDAGQLLGRGGDRPDRIGAADRTPDIVGAAEDDVEVTGVGSTRRAEEGIRLPAQAGHERRGIDARRAESEVAAAGT